MSDGPVLTVRGLRTSFATGHGRVRAVRSVDLELRRGEKLGLVGESGSGKSALALSVLGLLEPPGVVEGGEVRLNGRPISGLSDRDMRAVRGSEISLVYQDPMSALDPVKSIGAQLAEAVRQHESGLSRHAMRERCVKLLRDVEVPGAEARLSDYPHQYSGGMRQRVVIAMALAHQPEVVIADEPTTALDVTTQAQVLELLQKRVDEQGASVVLITHNMGLVAEFCDSVAVMYAGRIIERGPTVELFARPAHPYTDALLRAVPRRDGPRTGLLPTIPGAPPNLAALPPGCPFSPRCQLREGRARCVEDVPPPHVVAPGRTSECHFYAELRDGSRLMVVGA